LTQLHEAGVLDVRLNRARRTRDPARLERRRAEVRSVVRRVDQVLRQVDDVPSLLPVDHRIQADRAVRHVVHPADAEVWRGIAELHLLLAALSVLVREADELRDRLSNLDARTTERTESGAGREER